MPKHLRRSTPGRLPPWLRKKDKPKRVVVSVAWYTEQEWTKVRTTAADPERFENSYAEWESMAHQALRDLAETGIQASKTLVVASDLFAWLLLQGKPNDAASRAEYVSQAARQDDSAA